MNKNPRQKPKMMSEYHIKKNRDIQNTISINPLLIRQTGISGGVSQYLPYQATNSQAGIVFPTEKKPTDANIILSKLSQAGGVVGGVTSAYQTYNQIKDKYAQARQLISRYNQGEFDAHLQRFGLRRTPIEVDPSLEQEMNDWESVLGRNSRIGSLIEDDNVSNITQSDLESLQSFGTPEGGFQTPRVNIPDAPENLPDVPDVPIEAPETLPSVPTQPLELPPVSQETRQAFRTPQYLSDALDRENFSVRSVNAQARQTSFLRDLYNPNNGEEMLTRVERTARGLQRIREINPDYSLGDNVALETQYGIRTAPVSQTVGQAIRSIPSRINQSLENGYQSLRARLSTLGDRVSAQTDTIQNSLGQAYDTVNFEQMSGTTIPDTLELSGDASAGAEAGAEAGAGLEAGADAGAGIAGGVEASAAATAAATAGEAAAGVGAGLEAGEIAGEIGLGLLAFL